MAKSDRVLVVIPTYNEKENIRQLIPAVLRQGREVEVLVVDDASPDGTAAAVRRLAVARRGRVHLLQRAGKLGLGPAYVAGFQWGLGRGYGRFVQMDADWSHDPRAIRKFLKALESWDVVVGSRYYQGRVSVVNWPLRRLVLSTTANWYARLVTGLPLWDCTGGFKAFRRAVLERVGLERVKSDGYAFQVEVNFKAHKRGFRLKEIPIIFIDRTSGTSKMTSRIIREAVWRVWAMRFGF